MAIICRDHKLLFVMVPGTGCSVVGNALQEELDGTFFPEQPLRRDGRADIGRKHNTVPELLENDLLSEEERNEYLVFASVRNPFDRWVTYYQRYEGDWLEYYEGVSRRRIEREQENLDLSDDEIQRRWDQHEWRFQKLRRRQRIIRWLGFNTWMMGTLLRWAWNRDKGGRGDISRYAFPMLDGVDAVIRQERLNEGLTQILEHAGVDQQIDLPRRNATSGKKPYPEYYLWPTRMLAEAMLGDEMDALGYEFEGVVDDQSVVWLSDQNARRPSWRPASS